MFCSKCGTATAPNTAFCQVCGTAVQSSTPVPSSPMSAPQPAYAAAAVPSTDGTVSPHWLPPSTRAYAGFWLRFVAHLLDSLITGLVLLVLFVPILFLTGFGAAIRGFHPDNPPDPAMIAAFVSSIVFVAVLGAAAGWLYYAYFESSEWQATVGKKVLNLVVTDLNGDRISFGRASGRYFAKIISGLIPLGIGYILAGFTERKQALHDMIASCLVLRSQ